MYDHKLYEGFYHDPIYDPGDPDCEPEMPDGILVDEGLDDIFITKKIGNEDVSQISKWGFQEHHIFEWLTILTEEMGELGKATLKYMYERGKKEEITKEAIQVATLAIKIAKMAEEQF